MPSSREDAESEFVIEIEGEAKAEVLDDVIIELENARTHYHHNNSTLGMVDILLNKYREWRNEL